MRNTSSAHRLERIRQDMAELRQKLADLAGSVANTEEQLANTLESVARNKPPHDAKRLLARADAARQFALKERSQAARYGDLSPGDPPDEDRAGCEHAAIGPAPAFPPQPADG